jgi:methylated-DNA-[protein]-cysteine S-methyltransferase
MNEIFSKSELTAWLESDNQSGELPAVLRALDSLYLAGPTADEIAKSQTKLHRSLLVWTQQVIFYDGFSHPLVGTIFVAVNRRGLVALNFGVTEEQFLAQLDKSKSKAIIRSSGHTAEVMQQVYEYLNGDRTHFDLSVDLSQVSEFQKGVLLTTLEIPHGQIVTYGEIAKRLGNPKAARAVGQALGHNPIPIVIPCHRVIASNGSLGGYSAGGGLESKAKLLSLEGASLV